MVAETVCEEREMTNAEYFEALLQMFHHRDIDVIQKWGRRISEILVLFYIYNVLPSSPILLSRNVWSELVWGYQELISPEQISTFCGSPIDVDDSIGDNAIRYQGFDGGCHIVELYGMEYAIQKLNKAVWGE